MSEEFPLWSPQVARRTLIFTWVFLGFLLLGMIVGPAFALLVAFGPGTPLSQRVTLAALSLLIWICVAAVLYGPIRRRVRTGTWKVSAEERRAIAARPAPEPFRTSMVVFNLLMPVYWAAFAAFMWRSALRVPQNSDKKMVAVLWSVAAALQLSNSVRFLQKARAARTIASG